MNNDDVIEQVRLLAPDVEATSEIERARQRRKLTNAIAAESALPEVEGAPAHRRKRRLARGHASRRRVYLAGAAAAMVAAAGAAIPLSLGASSPAASRGTKSASPVMQLASYRLRLPRNYRLTAAVTSDCHPYVVFNSPTGESDVAPITPSYASQVASAAGSSGGCVFLALLPPYTPAAASPDPEQAALSSAEQVQVGQYQAWVGTTDAAHDPGTGAAIVETMLYVEIPVAGGQTQDLVVGDYGLSQSNLISLVTNGLSVAGTSAASGTAIPTLPGPVTTPSGGTSTMGNTGSTANSGTSDNTGAEGNSGTSTS